MVKTVAAALLRLRRGFDEQGFATAALDARLLVQHVIGADHAALIAEPDRVLSEDEWALLARFENQRRAGEPVSRIIGVREFYGRDFRITKAVLDPRPDTETVIDLCLKHFDRGRAFRFADMGSGSGAIAVTLLAECSLARGVAVDVSTAALDVARGNAEAHGVLARLDFAESDWFAKVDGSFDLIVSNPPYIRDGDIAGLDAGVRDHDPLLALAGGADGLACYRALATGTPLKKGGFIVVEAGHDQAPDIKSILCGNGLIFIDQAVDLSGFIRALAFAKA